MARTPKPPINPIDKESLEAQNAEVKISAAHLLFEKLQADSDGKIQKQNTKILEEIKNLLNKMSLASGGPGGSGEPGEPDEKQTSKKPKFTLRKEKNPSTKYRIAKGEEGAGQFISDAQKRTREIESVSYEERIEERKKRPGWLSLIGKATAAKTGFGSSDRAEEEREEGRKRDKEGKITGYKGWRGTVAKTHDVTEAATTRATATSRWLGEQTFGRADRGKQRLENALLAQGERTLANDSIHERQFDELREEIKRTSELERTTDRQNRLKDRDEKATGQAKAVNTIAGGTGATGGAGAGSRAAPGTGSAKVGGAFGKFFGSAIGGALGSALGAFGSGFLAFMGPARAGLFAAAFPLFGIGIAGFVGAIGLGFAGAAAVVGKGLDVLQPALDKMSGTIQKFETLDSERLSIVGKGMGDFFDSLPFLPILIPDGKEMESLAAALVKMDKVDGEKLKLIGPAVKQMGEGLKQAGLGELFSSLAQLLGGDKGGIKQQITDLADGLIKFQSVDADNLAKVGPAVENLGKGLKAMASGGLKDALGGIVGAFGSIFGAEKEDPIANIKKFAVLGEGKTGEDLKLAGQAISGLGLGLKDLNNLNVDDLKTLGKDILPPLTKLGATFATLGEAKFDSVGKTVEALHNLDGLEKLKFNAISVGLGSIGAGFEQLADHIDDGEIKTLERWASVMTKVKGVFGEGSRHVSTGSKGTPPDLTWERDMAFHNMSGESGASGTVPIHRELRAQQIRKKTPYSKSKSTPKSKIQKQAKAEYKTAFEEGAIATKALEEFKTEAGDPDIERRAKIRGQIAYGINVKGYKDPEKQKEFDRLKSAVFKSKTEQKRAGAKYAAAEGVTDTYKFGKDRNRRNDMKAKRMKIVGLLKRGYTVEQLQTFSPKAIKQMESGNGIITIGETRFPMQALGLYEEIIKKELQPNLQPPTVAPLTQDIATQSPAIAAGQRNISSTNVTDASQIDASETVIHNNSHISKGSVSSRKSQLLGGMYDNRPNY